MRDTLVELRPTVSLQEDEKQLDPITKPEQEILTRLVCTLLHAACGNAWTKSGSPFYEGADKLVTLQTRLLMASTPSALTFKDSEDGAKQYMEANQLNEYLLEFVRAFTSALAQWAVDVASSEDVQLAGEHVESVNPASLMSACMYIFRLVGSSNDLSNFSPLKEVDYDTQCHEMLRMALVYAPINVQQRISEHEHYFNDTIDIALGVRRSVAVESIVMSICDPVHRESTFRYIFDAFDGDLSRQSMRHVLEEDSASLRKTGVALKHYGIACLVDMEASLMCVLERALGSEYLDGEADVEAEMNHLAHDLHTRLAKMTNDDIFNEPCSTESIKKSPNQKKISTSLTRFIVNNFVTVCDQDKEYLDEAMACRCQRINVQGRSFVSLYEYAAYLLENDPQHLTMFTAVPVAFWTIVFASLKQSIHDILQVSHGSVECEALRQRDSCVALDILSALPKRLPDVDVGTHIHETARICDILVQTMCVDKIGPQSKSNSDKRICTVTRDKKTNEVLETNCSLQLEVAITASTPPEMDVFLTRNPENTIRNSNMACVTMWIVIRSTLFTRLRKLHSSHLRLTSTHDYDPIMVGVASADSMLAISFLVSTDGVTHLAVDEGRNVAQRTQNTDYSSIEVSHANYTYKSVHSLMSIMQPLAYEVTRVSAAETLSDLRAQYQKQEEPFMQPKNEKSYPLWSKVCDTRSNSCARHTPYAESTHIVHQINGTFCDRLVKNVDSMVYVDTNGNEDDTNTVSTTSMAVKTALVQFATSATGSCLQTFMRNYAAHNTTKLKEYDTYYLSGSDCIRTASSKSHKGHSSNARKGHARKAIHKNKKTMGTMKRCANKDDSDEEYDDDDFDYQETFPSLSSVTNA